ncbi:hypothetical protein PR202_gb17386 [Eleusine coracana subsp. coracana]|uniref:Pre-mRNA-splicing factor Syf1/CRNKL1-like C-terminal HAT-repeats domain-containing protein n=1 Tax=Eleusine coracana subsp. coracana TaxID=191504 RepID=A0AAV5F0I4_ELECO|nr:hypothetical protein PR202_gb17386 [Eleusine coracana subsp. coracana]
MQTHPVRPATTYAEAIRSVDPRKATGKPHTLWVAFAKMDEGRGMLDSAREVFRRATQVDFSVDEPPCGKLWCFYADLMETHGGLDATLAVYEKTHDLGLATPLLVLNAGRQALVFLR